MTDRVDQIIAGLMALPPSPAVDAAIAQMRKMDADRETWRGIAFQLQAQAQRWREILEKDRRSGAEFWLLSPMRETFRGRWDLELRRWRLEDDTLITDDTGWLCAPCVAPPVPAAAE